MRLYRILFGAAYLAASVPLMAQTVPVESAAATATAATIEAQDGDDDGGNPRLGLLGLLGLAGLLGLLRREPDIHIDARREPPPPGT